MSAPVSPQLATASGMAIVNESRDVSRLDHEHFSFVIIVFHPEFGSLD